MNKNLLDELTGKTTDHLYFHRDLNCQIHKKIFEPLNLLNELLRKNKFKLHVVSSFRSYEHQKKIWEEKVSGKRILLDEYELPVDVRFIDKTELLFLILNWSMIPGFSRHHLGTDLDVCDMSRPPSDYKIKLTSDECEENGPFYEFHEFLDRIIETDNSYGFFRPYTALSEGVKPERWHISHQAVSWSYLENLTIDVFVDFIAKSDLSLKDEILDHAEIIYDNYIKIN